MLKTRLEAFSDGVIAIVITIMVLELEVPHGTDLASLRPIIPAFLSYVLSFIFVGIYWNNHHHMLHATKSINGRILDSPLAKGVGRDRKGWLSLALYASAIPLAFVNQWISDALYITVALIWLIPDRRIERHLHPPTAPDGR